MIRETRYLITAILLFLAAIADAQITTSSMSGRVTDAAAQAIMGATVRVVHEPSGTAYGTVTDASGRYAISGMKAGGPYRVSVS
ncbi:MAG: carboxypeptidase-like regulatory domain-containing protein, partial [Prevotella sp.]|nr:carboxypeptidase-like regulatory domain-containing protein [Prevotella sp.]